MAHVGDQYIIELDKDLGDGVFRIKGFRTLVFDEYGLKQLAPYKVKEDFEIGDEVVTNAGDRGVVVGFGFEADKDALRIMSHSGGLYSGRCTGDIWHKTGRKFGAIASTMKKLAETK